MKKYAGDAPEKDFRSRYSLPFHHIRQEYAKDTLYATEYEGYVQATIDLLPPPSARVLDVGCGDGFISMRAADLGHDVVGVDNSEDAIMHAKKLVPKATFECEDVRELSEKEQFKETFDAAYCVEVLEHIPPENVSDVLVGIHQCLKKDGIFVGSVPSKNLPVAKLHYQHFNPSDLTSFLEDAGFKQIEIIPQWKLGLLTNSLFWRLIRNNYYDLVLPRRILAKYVLKKCNLGMPADKALRYLFTCVPAK